MKKQSPRLKPLRKSLSQIPENAVFWLLLFSLAIGSAASLKQKITDRADAYEVHTEHLLVSPAANSTSVISIREQISPELWSELAVGLPCLHSTTVGCQLADRH